MAKRRNRPGQRDHSSIARPPLLPVVSPTRFERLAILEFEDRRRFRPDPFSLPLSPRKDQRRIVERVSRPVGKANKVARFGRDYKLAFAVPRKVSLCVRRKQRREVMFAMRRTGKGARAVRRRRNQFSDVRC